jgi:spermidine synthase
MPVWQWMFVSCFAASGAAALLYQVTWTRLFTLALGHTVAAASTVLAASMGGLALGAWLAGRFLPRLGRRLQCYAALEVLVALIAISLPFVLHELRPALAWAYADGGEPVRLAFVRVILSLAVLGVPSAAMGATFPIAAAWLADVTERRTLSSRRAAVDASVVYAANTAGAAAGAICAGFWLIPAIGLRGTTWVGVALNIVAALGAVWLSRTMMAETPAVAPARSSTTARERSSRKLRVPVAGPPPQPGLACAAAALSGFAALAYEVAWTRVLALVIGPTTYAFSTMAASFITGIALGAAAGSRLVRRVSRPDLWLAGMLVVTAGTAWMAIWFTASRLPLHLARELARTDGFESVLLRQVLTVGALLLPTGIALGATFTMALATASSGPGTVGRDAARVYGANTCGAVAGALLAGFVLLPRFGLQGTATVVTAVTLAGGFAVAVRALARHAETNHARAAIVALATCCGLLTLVIDLPAWDRDLLSSGGYKYAQNVGADELEAALRAGTLDYYKEGAAATVSVRRRAGTRALVIDGKVDASDGVDMLTQRLLGLLPVLLHPSPQDMLVIGLGSGVTVGAALASGEVRRADVVEISPEVVEASAFFAEENGHALQAPAVRLVTGDGRSHVLLAKRQYDVIISEPSNPWMAGVAALFTREFFEAARARLKPGGLICQWAHTYEISESDLKSIVATFASVFPEGTMWLVGDGDLLLIGTTDADIVSRLTRMRDRLRVGSIPALLGEMGIAPEVAPFVLLSHFAGGPSELASYGEGAMLQGDDRMALEFTAPAAMYARTVNQNVATIAALTAGGELPPVVSSVLRGADARSWTARGSVALQAAAYGIAYESFRRATALDDRDVVALRGASGAAAGANRLAEAQQWLEGRAARDPRNVPVRVELSRLLIIRGDSDRAIAVVTDAIRTEPENPLPREQLASIFADLGDSERLGAVADDLVARFPERDDTQYYHAVSLWLRGRASEASEKARQVLRANPGYVKAHTLVGVACAAEGRLECARVAFETAINLNPRDPSSYVNLGSVSLDSGNPTAAASYFAEALVIDPRSTAARDGLARTRAMQGPGHGLEPPPGG